MHHDIRCSLHRLALGVWGIPFWAVSLILNKYMGETMSWKYLGHVKSKMQLEFLVSFVALYFCPSKEPLIRVWFMPR